MFSRAPATTAMTVVAAMTTATTTARWTTGTAAQLTASSATLVSALFVPLLTSRNERSSQQYGTCRR